MSQEKFLYFSHLDKEQDIKRIQFIGKQTIIIIRHIEPTLAFQLDLRKMSQYEIKR
jgi:hypothetical protein